MREALEGMAGMHLREGSTIRIVDERSGENDEVRK